MHAIRIRQSLILLLALGLHLSCAPQTEQGGEAEAPAAAVDDEAAVRAVAETWDPMMNGADLDGMMSLFADDAVRLDAGAPPSIGLEAIRRSFQRAFESASFEGSGPVEEIEVAGDWAFARGSFTEQLTDKASGEVTEEAGKWVSVFRKTQEGWTYAIDIWNRDAPSSAAVNLEAEVDTPALPEEITTGRSPDEPDHAGQLRGRARERGRGRRGSSLRHGGRGRLGLRLGNMVGDLQRQGNERADRGQRELAQHPEEDAGRLEVLSRYLEPGRLSHKVRVGVRSSQARPRRGLLRGRAALARAAAPWLRPDATSRSRARRQCPRASSRALPAWL